MEPLLWYNGSSRMVNNVTKHRRHREKPYNTTALTTRRLDDLLPGVLQKIGRIHQMRPDLVLAAWPEIIGEKLAPMTQAVSFEEGILVVKVKNSTLHSLLSQNDKFRILRKLRQKFPKMAIKNIVFRIG